MSINLVYQISGNKDDKYDERLLSNLCYVKRGLAGKTIYHHYFIQIDSNWSLELNGDIGKKTAHIREIETTKILNGDEMIVLESPKDQNRALEIARRGYDLIGHNGYDLMVCNCEHFATYCYFGETKSIQVDKAQRYFPPLWLASGLRKIKFIRKVRNRTSAILDLIMNRTMNEIWGKIPLEAYITGDALAENLIALSKLELEYYVKNDKRMIKEFYENWWDIPLFNDCFALYFDDIYLLQWKEKIRHINVKQLSKFQRINEYFHYLNKENSSRLQKPFTLSASHVNLKMSEALYSYRMYIIENDIYKGKGNYLFYRKALPHHYFLNYLGTYSEQDR